jgi:hypothetical protein
MRNILQDIAELYQPVDASAFAHLRLSGPPLQ